MQAAARPWPKPGYSGYSGDGYPPYSPNRRNDCSRHRRPLPAGQIAGVILNHVASRHLALVSEALAAYQISLFGSVPSRDGLSIPSRHLGLVQAADFDNAGVEQILDHAADLIEEYCDLDAIIDAAQRLPTAYKAVAAMPVPLTTHRQ